MPCWASNCRWRRFFPDLRPAAFVIPTGTVRTTVGGVPNLHDGPTAANLARQKNAPYDNARSPPHPLIGSRALPLNWVAKPRAGNRCCRGGTSDRCRGGRRPGSPADRRRATSRRAKRGTSLFRHFSDFSPRLVPRIFRKIFRRTNLRTTPIHFRSCQKSPNALGAFRPTGLVSPWLFSAHQPTVSRRSPRHLGQPRRPLPRTPTPPPWASGSSIPAAVSSVFLKKPACRSTKPAPPGGGRL